VDLLKNKQFLKLWGNQILLQIAFNMSNLTALLLIDNLTSSRFALAQFYAALTLPAFLVGVFAGSIVDLSNRKTLMLVTDAVLAILFVLYAAVSGSYLGLLAIAFLSSSVAQFFTPAEAATIPLIVKDKLLPQANALFLFTSFGAVVAGYALAGPLIDAFGGLYAKGDQAVFITAGILTAIGFFLRLSLKTIELPRQKWGKEEIVDRTINMTKEVLSVAKEDVKIYMPIILLTLVQFYIGLLAILFIDFVKVYLFLPSTSTSWVLVLPLMAGLTIGTYLLKLTHKKWRRGNVIYHGTVLFGLIIFILGVSAQLVHPQPILRIITMFVSMSVGISAVLISVHARTVLQEHTPERMLGRVFALVTVAASATIPIPILLLALLTEKLAAGFIFIGFGVISLILAISMRPILVKRIY